MEQDVESFISICELQRGDCQVNIRLSVSKKYRDENKITTTSQTQKWAKGLIESAGR